MFISFSGNAQKLDLKIDSISGDDRDLVERIFTIHYHLENLTDEKVRFFLETNSIVPSTGGSGTSFPFYKIYENDAFLEIGSVFSGWGLTEINQEGMVEMEKGFFRVTHQKKLDSIRESKRYIQNKIITMTPREVKKFSMNFYWDRNRYYQNHDMEYYLDEKANHFLEITMVMQKAIYKNELPEAFFDEITTDVNFTEGVFTSNKIKINF